MTKVTRGIRAFISGISVFAVLTIVFLVLKLTGVIAWSWWAVCSPLLIYAALIILMCLITLGLYLYYRKKH